MELLCFNPPENADGLPEEEWFLVNPTIAQMIILLQRGREYGVKIPGQVRSVGIKKKSGKTAVRLT